MQPEHHKSQSRQNSKLWSPNKTDLHQVVQTAQRSYLYPLHHSCIQGLALVPLCAVALQPGVLQGVLGCGPGLGVPVPTPAVTIRENLMDQTPQHCIKTENNCIATVIHLLMAAAYHR